MIAGIILICCFSGCDNNGNDFYGTYTFEKVSYLSPVSSSSLDYLNKKMAGAKYTIAADVFKIESTAGDTTEIRSPNYGKETPSKNPFYDARTLDGEEIKCQYTIYDKDGNKTHRRLYVSSGSLWIASYTDNNANGYELPMEIYKLSKQ